MCVCVCKDRKLYNIYGYREQLEIKLKQLNNVHTAYSIYTIDVLCY